MCPLYATLAKRRLRVGHVRVGIVVLSGRRLSLPRIMRIQRVTEAVAGHHGVYPLNPDVTKTVRAHVAGIEDIIGIRSIHDY
jgi:hypothetical protein